MESSIHRTPIYDFEGFHFSLGNGLRTVAWIHEFVICLRDYHKLSHVVRTGRTWGTSQALGMTLPPTRTVTKSISRGLHKVALAVQSKALCRGTFIVDCGKGYFSLNITATKAESITNWLNHISSLPSQSCPQPVETYAVHYSSKSQTHSPSLGESCRKIATTSNDPISCSESASYDNSTSCSWSLQRSILYLLSYLIC